MTDKELPFDDDETSGNGEALPADDEYDDLSDRAESAYIDDEVDFDPQGMAPQGPITGVFDAIVIGRPVLKPFKDGTRAIRIPFMITTEGEYQGIRRTRACALEGQWKWRYAETCEALGMQDVAEGKRKARLPEFEGKRATIYLKVQANNPEYDEMYKVRPLGEDTPSIFGDEP